jgi:hypothetical protein
MQNFVFYPYMFLEQSPWEVNSHLANQITFLNQEIHYFVLKSLPLVTVVNWINSVHIITFI